MYQIKYVTCAKVLQDLNTVKYRYSENDKNVLACGCVKVLGEMAMLKFTITVNSSHK